MALTLLAAVGAAVVTAGREAEASTRVCRQIERDLAALGRGGGASSSQSRRYDRAIEAQQDQIDRVRRQMRQSGCISFIPGLGGASCASLNRTLGRMQSNLAALESTRGRMGGGGGDTRRERARLLASLDANDCREAVVDRGQRTLPPVRSAAREERRQGSIFDQLFDGQPQRRRTIDDNAPIDNVRRVPGYEIEYPGFGAGSYRTLCVRTCDGYYFPISHASNPSDFARDEKNCNTMCPGTEVKLFAHRVPDQESEAMVGLDGTPYTSMPNAFKYRDASFTRPEGCGCGRTANRNFEVIAGEQADPASADAPTQEQGCQSFVVAPTPRPDPAADPETQANRDGGFDATAMERLAGSKPVAGALPAERKVRVVGPEFLPDPEAAIDLRAPALRTVQ